MWPLYLLAVVATASAQIPSLGYCPDFQPMANFNMNRFLGTWYEAERYFTVSELGTRCVTTNYLSTPEGRIVVSNEITNSLTGYKRVMEGSLQMIGREGEGRVLVKYSQLPLPYESEFSILDTDYDNFAVMWSCSGIGPVHTQNVWLLTRDRLPSLNVMTSAYNVLDRYKISRTFFVKTNQADCTVLPDPAAVPPVERSAVVEPVVVKEDKVEVFRPVAKSAVADVKAAEPVPEEVKAMQVPELIMSESEKKEEMMEKIKLPEPMKDMPMKDMPMKEMPMKEIPMKEKPMKDMPMKEKPMKDMPMKDMPMKDMPMKDMPMKDMPMKDMPMKDMPMKDMPMKDMPMKDMPMKDMPMKDMPMKENKPMNEMPMKDMKDMPEKKKEPAMTVV